MKHPMPFVLASRIMRTTVDIADPILDDVRRVQETEGKTLGQVITELLAEGLAVRLSGAPPSEFHWIAKPLHPRIDLRDKDALWSALDRGDESRP